MRDFAAAGPAFAQVLRHGPIDWDAWSRSAATLSRSLPFAADDAARDSLIHHLYLPILSFWIARRHAVPGRPVLIGLQAPQGAGKTTLVRLLLSLLPDLGLRGMSVSIDDFYLTRAGQLELAARHSGNPYLEHRGYPGTHDVDLGERTIRALRSIDRNGTVRVPVYDKSRHEGRGDRAPEPEWREVAGPLDLVIVEGWMLGFEPVPRARIEDEHLVEPNRALAEYDRWHRLIDAFVVLRANDPSFVLRWRVEAEEAMKTQGLPGLSRAAIEDYIRRFLPAYALWAGRAPSRFGDRDTLVIHLDEERRASLPGRG
jgi:D-glycerate 3-kinase